MTSEEHQLLKRIEDNEHEIASLHRQQRDVKFLAKRFFDELQLRLNKRAMRTNHDKRHIYRVDQAIREKLQAALGEKHEALRFIHEQDRQNVVLQKSSPFSVIKPIFWKVAAKLFALIYLFTKKVGARVR